MQYSSQFSFFLDLVDFSNMNFIYNHWLFQIKKVFTLHTYFWQITSETWCDNMGHKSDEIRQEDKICKYQWAHYLVSRRLLIGQYLYQGESGVIRQHLHLMWRSSFSSTIWIVYLPSTVVSEIKHPLMLISRYWSYNIVPSSITFLLILLYSSIKCKTPLSPLQKKMTISSQWHIDMYRRYFGASSLKSDCLIF